MSTRAWLVLLILLGACHRSKPSAPPGECAKTLPSASHALTPAPPPPPLPDSKIVVRASIPVEIVRAKIESEVPKRVAAESGRSIGSAGQVTYTVDRGPFSVSVVKSAVIATTDLFVHATVCKPIDYVGCVQYASCTPQMRVTASVPTQLKDDWSWSGSSVSIDVTKPCLVTALDVDVTPVMVANAKTETAKVKARIDASLPKVKDDAARGWEKAQTSVPFGSGCFALHPTSIVQGPTTLENAEIVARFAAIAQPGVDTPCIEPPPPSPLPSLAHDETMGDGFDMHVAVRYASTALAEILSDPAKASPIDALRVTSLSAQPSSAGIALDVALAGSTCGTAFFDATPRWDADRHAVVFDPLTPSTGEAQRFAPSTSDSIAAELRRRLFFNPTADDRSLATGFSDLARLASAEDRTFDVQVTKGAEEATLVTPQGLELRFDLQGNASFRATKLDK